MVLAITLIVAMPMALEAQQSGSIRVGVRIVRSVLPETRAATAEQIKHLAETDVNNVKIVKRTVETNRGIALVTTEDLASTPAIVVDLPPAAEEINAKDDLARALITVAFTAN